MQAEPRLGQDVQVRIIDVKDDGSLNASLLPRKHERLSDDAEKIFAYLQDVGGKMPFGDKSAPEEIQEMFDMSKAAFKRALGTSNESTAKLHNKMAGQKKLNYPTNY